MVIEDRWLSERGYLHDAHVTSARAVAGNIEIKIDDEWANERGLSQPEAEKCPLTLKFVSATVLEGNLSEAEGGWISELLPESSGRFRFIFIDRDVLLMQANSIVCEAGV